jgi:methyl-accepting chemotaxis protein
MATRYAANDPQTLRARPLILAYWLMPLATGLAVTATAAGMLIETLVLANRIDANVTPISQAVGDIKLHTDTIGVLTTVDKSAAGIKAAADPLSKNAADILTSVGAIQSTVGQIDSNTGSIRAHAGTIDGTVGSIAPHVLAIAIPAESIEARIPTTLGLAGSILSVLAAVRGDTASLLVSPELPTINAHANSIDCKLGPGGACK